jgi:hypothetical protein
VKSVDLLPIITEQINPQHQFTATIQIPSHGLQVDVQLNNQKKKRKKKKKRESIWGFRQEPSNRDQTSDFNGLGSRIDGGSVGGGQLERRGSVGGGHPDRRGLVGAPGSMGSVGGGQLDRRGSVGGVHPDRDGFSQPIPQAISGGDGLRGRLDVGGCRPDSSSWSGAVGTACYSGICWALGSRGGGFL